MLLLRIEGGQGSLLVDCVKCWWQVEENEKWKEMERQLKKSQKWYYSAVADVWTTQSKGANILCFIEGRQYVTRCYGAISDHNDEGLVWWSGALWKGLDQVGRWLDYRTRLIVGSLQSNSCTKQPIAKFDYTLTQKQTKKNFGLNR